MKPGNWIIAGIAGSKDACYLRQEAILSRGLLTSAAQSLAPPHQDHSQLAQQLQYISKGWMENCSNLIVFF